MKCQCGSQFLPILKAQKKCITCLVLDACRKNKKKDNKNDR